MQAIQRYVELGFIHYGWSLVDYLLWATVSRRKPFNEVLVYGGERGSGPTRRFFTEQLTRMVDPEAMVHDSGDRRSLVEAFKSTRRGRIPIAALDLTRLPSSSMPLIAQAVAVSRSRIINLVLSAPSLEQLHPSFKQLATFMVRVDANGEYMVKRNIWDVRPRKCKAAFTQILIETGKVERKGG